MTALARLRRRPRFSWASLDDGDEVAPGELMPAIPAELSIGLMLDCIVDHPPSLAGRRIVLHVAPEEIDWLLRQVRTEAIRQRSRPLGAPS